MTAVSSNPSPSPSRWRSGRRRSSSAGSALVARAEPLIWLSGSAMLLTAMMIFGLLLLILREGAATFWPRPVAQFALTGNTHAVGEVMRNEMYRLESENVAGMSSSEAASARRLLGDRPNVEAMRYLVRTGNFELTNEHYRWIDETAIAEDGITYPEWAVVLERVSWGRFYGTPERFLLHHPRPISGDEQQLQRFIEFVEQNLFRLEETEQAAFQKTLEADRKRLHEMQVESSRTLIARLKSAGEHRTLEAVLADGSVVALPALAEDAVVSNVIEAWTTPKEAWARYEEHHRPVRQLVTDLDHLRKDVIGAANDVEEEARLAVRQQELDQKISLLPKVRAWSELSDQTAELNRQVAEAAEIGRQAERRFGSADPTLAAVKKIISAVSTELEASGAEPNAEIQRLLEQFQAMPAPTERAIAEYRETRERLAREMARVQSEMTELTREVERYELQMKTGTGELSTLRVSEIVLGYPANQLTLTGKLAVYGFRWREFLLDDPREANSEGGVFPAIWGTITMTMIMSIAVVPFGVLAALYLREYARGGFMVSAVRIAVNNLAGVPSIVFGVFGFGFFCYIIGAYVDGGPENAGFRVWPSRTWFVTAAFFAGTAFTAFLCGLFSLTSRKAEASLWKRWMGRMSVVLWLVASALLLLMLMRLPFFHGFYPAKLPNPTFGKGGLIWASLTLALMTLPVVIVATEEALAAVPNSMREGSYACGASKWQTIQRIVLPRALPGIMTGMILAMARGAGEVAPLMLVGAVKLVPELPLDSTPPFLHPERSFMHLGFHIFDLGFQSQNSEAAKPMVFTTTLLLITIIAILNLSAIWLRSRLRRRYQVSQF